MVPARKLVALVLLTLFWGINWPVMKLSLREITPLYFRAITVTGEQPHAQDLAAVVLIILALSAALLPRRDQALIENGVKSVSRS